MNFKTLQTLPEFLSSDDLVQLGLWPTTSAVYFARIRGNGPDFIKIGRKIFYPKTSVIDFVSQAIAKGNIPKTNGDPSS